VIYERVHDIAEVGAGIKMAPNALGRFGLLGKIMQKANVLERRRWQDGGELGKAELMPAGSDVEAMDKRMELG
jgi:salicylate hydroxylase